MKAIGSHHRTELSDSKDVNGRYMVTCRDCETCAHAYQVEDAEADLASAPCVSNCDNCNKLRRSYDDAPAVPLGGTCNTVLHICPNDGRRWWQSNTHFHLWQQVTDDREWDGLHRQQSDMGGRDHAWSC